MLSRLVSAVFNDGNIATGRPGWSARVANRLGALSFAKGMGPNAACHARSPGAQIRTDHFVPGCRHRLPGERYLVSMLGQKANWGAETCAQITMAFWYAGRREEVTLVEDLSDHRAAILRRYLELAAGARPFFTVDRRAPLDDFERIVDQYPVFRSPKRSTKPGPGSGVTLCAVISWRQCAHTRIGSAV